jgi:RNA polymerase sigma-70 factor (ECF subfamily)
MTMASSLNAEIELLRAVQLKIQAGDGLAALALLDRHDSLHASGVLIQERQAARILALCLLGRIPEAQREADAFAHEWPRSPHLSRVRASCINTGTTGQRLKNR